MLTERQSAILDFLRDAIRREGVSPSFADIQRRFSLASPASVTEHLNALERKGVIRRVPGQKRNIRLIDPEPVARALSIPVFGAIPAGFAEHAEQRTDRTIAFDEELLGASSAARLFGMDVRGDSMIGAGILDGDVVILEHGAEAKSGVKKCTGRATWKVRCERSRW